MSVMLPTLKSLRIPNYKEKQEKLVPSVQREEIAKKIFEFSLKVGIFDAGMSRHIPRGICLILRDSDDLVFKNTSQLAQIIDSFIWS